MEVLHEAGIPKGVVNLVTGSAGEVGDPLVRDERVVAISFTGSNAVGNELKKVASERGAKLQLELGGKNPAIVLADADLDHAVQQLINGAMMSTGQKCTATSRAIIDRRVADEVTEKLVSKIGALTVGDPSDAATVLGPVIDEKAAERIIGDIGKGTSEGAQVLVGGGRPNGELDTARVTSFRRHCLAA